MTDYTVVIEGAGANHSAYVIGLDGVITTGRSVEEILANMREAIPFHLEGMRQGGVNEFAPLPLVSTVVID